MIARIVQAFRDRSRRKTLYATPAYWDSKAERSGTGSPTSMWPNASLNSYYYLEEQKAVASSGLELEGASVLDLGCGTGTYSRHFASAGANVTGMDFSEKTLKAARLLSSGPNPAYVQGSFFELADESRYDLVFAKSVLAMACHGPDELKDAFSRVGKALKPGGTLLLIEPVHTGFLSRVLDMSLKTFTACLEDTGFEVLTIRPVIFWPTRLALAYLPFPRFITAPGYHAGRLMMKLPLLNRLGDYWMFKARIAQAGPSDGGSGTGEETDVQEQIPGGRP